MSQMNRNIKRFYKIASTRKTDEGYLILLDGKPVHTPSGKDLIAPEKLLADAIVAEWGAQGDVVAPDTMPLTQILNTAIDQARARNDITNSLLKYLNTDLLCYRTKEPDVLKKRQKEFWDPWLSWFDEHFETPLLTTFGLQALTQEPETHKRIWNYIEALDPYYFALLHILTALTGSIVMALAFIEGDITPGEVFAAMHVEEDYHADLCGENAETKPAQDNQRTQDIHRDLTAAKRFIDLLNGT